MHSLAEVKKMNSAANHAAAAQSQGVVSSFPTRITLMPLTRCNYKCRMCGEWKKAEQPELPRETLDKLKPVLPFASSLFITGGEPFMYRHLADLLAMGRKAGVSLSMVTNGSLFGDAPRKLVMDNDLRQVKFSLDAATQKTYAHIRGGNLFKVLSNIANLSLERAKRNTRFPQIQLGFVAMRSNIAELGKLVAISKEIGVDSIYVSYCQINCREMIPESLYLHQDYSDLHMHKAAAIARQVGLSLELPPLFGARELRDEPADQFCRLTRTCVEPWEHVFIRANGACSMCCGGGGHAGNLNEMTFDEVWNHSLRVEARQKVNTDAPPKKCRACRTLKQNARNPKTHFYGQDILRSALRSRKGQDLAAAVNE